MDRIVVSTVVYRAPEEVFPYLRSFTDYPRYAEHLQSVTQRGDGDEGESDGDVDATVDEDGSSASDGTTGSGGPGTAYDLHLTWWKLSYTAHSEVTAIDEPESLEWRLTEDVDATGTWRVVEEPEAAPEGEETASRIYFEATYDPHSADGDAVSLPRFVSLDWVVRKLQPRLLAEAERIVERLVTDIEGRPRDVELVVHEAP